VDQPGTRQVLAIVEHDEIALRRDRLNQPRQDRMAWLLADPNRGRTRRAHDRRIRKPEPDSVDILTQHFARELQRQAGLANTARASGRQEPGWLKLLDK